jgi:hypothetical protein
MQALESSLVLVYLLFSEGNYLHEGFDFFLRFFQLGRLPSRSILSVEHLLVSFELTSIDL